MEGEGRVRQELLGVIAGLLFLVMILGGIAMVVPAAAQACAGVLVVVGVFGLVSIVLWNS